jgi:hypothetical protein
VACSSLCPPTTYSGSASTPVIEATTVQTAPLPHDVHEAVIEALARMLVADFRGRSDAMVGSPSGVDHGD